MGQAPIDLELSSISMAVLPHPEGSMLRWKLLCFAVFITTVLSSPFSNLLGSRLEIEGLDTDSAAYKSLQARAEAQVRMKLGPGRVDETTSAKHIPSSPVLSAEDLESIIANVEAKASRQWFLPRRSLGKRIEQVTRNHLIKKAEKDCGIPPLTHESWDKLRTTEFLVGIMDELHEAKSNNRTFLEDHTPVTDIASVCFTDRSCHSTRHYTYHNMATNMGHRSSGPGMTICDI